MLSILLCNHMCLQKRSTLLKIIDVLNASIKIHMKWFTPHNWLFSLESDEQNYIPISIFPKFI